MTRLFYALDIETKDKQKIAQWRDENLPLLKKPAIENNLHITLAFLGNISIQKKCVLEKNTKNLLTNLDFTRLLSNEASKNGTLEFNQLALFKKPKVLYLGMLNVPEWLTTLAGVLSEMAKEINIYQEERIYKPHVTLARKANFVPNINTFNLSVHVTSFSLYESKSTENGVEYFPLKTWLLR